VGSDAGSAGYVTEPSANLRVLVIGYGLIGRQRVEALGNLSGVRLAGTVDPATADPSASTGAPHHTDIAEVSPDVYDAAIIAVPHDHATALAEAVLQSNRPVLIEKPLAIAAAQARRLEQLASFVPIPSFVGYNYRFLPAIQAILNVASSGRLGRLRNVDMLLGHGGHPESAEGWKLDPVRAGGGVLLDPGVHLFDLLLRLAPGIECTDVQATRGFWRTGIEEDVVATFCQDALLATVRVSHIRWVNTFRVEVIGEDGYAMAEGRGGNYGPMRLRIGKRWAWSEPGAGSQRETEEKQDFGTEDLSLRDELEAVVRAWHCGDHEEGAVRPATMEEGRGVTELCEALYLRLP
jgi:1,5-anhydro-D-fructose reductase (1,5-anhydro-D-mannitol-forming)